MLFVIPPRAFDFRRPRPDRRGRLARRVLVLALASAAVHLVALVSPLTPMPSTPTEDGGPQEGMRVRRYLPPPPPEPEPEQVEPEPEQEPEPPKPIESVKKLRRPKPKPEPEPVDAEPELDGDGGEGGGGPVFAGDPFGKGGGGPGPGGARAIRPGSGKATGETRGPGQAKPKKPTQPKKPKKTAKKALDVDPTKPIDRPSHATAPKPLASNEQPTYPEALRDSGITGSVVLKLHVHRDGRVRGAKIYKVNSTAGTQEEKRRAHALFKKAVVAAVKTWRYTPATLEGEPISVWNTVTIRFRFGK